MSRYYFSFLLLAEFFLLLVLPEIGAHYLFSWLVYGPCLAVFLINGVVLFIYPVLRKKGHATQAMHNLLLLLTVISVGLVTLLILTSSMIQDFVPFAPARPEQKSF